MNERRDTDLPKHTVYFSAADRQTEVFIRFERRQSEFETSLVHSLLFEDAVLLPDAFYFTSTGLYAHLRAHSEANTTSLFEAATRTGVAIPAFREPGTETFAASNQIIEDTQLLGLRARTDREFVAARLDQAVGLGDADSSFRSVSWPSHSVGERYGERLRSFLRPDSGAPPIATPAVAELWNQTTTWRTDCFDEAAERAADVGGFRRGDYMTALGRALGLRGPVGDMAELVKAGRGPSEAWALRVLCLWINECYHYSQAREFGVRPSWPQFLPELSLATLAAMEPDDGGPAPASAVNVTVVAPMPPPEVLARLDGNLLMAVRQGPAACDYFDALAAWRARPFSEDGVEAVRRQFSAYARAVRGLTGTLPQHSKGPVELCLTALDGASRGAVVAAGAAFATLFPEVTRAATPFVALGGAAWASYQWLNDRPKATAYVLQAPFDLSIS